ncbi:hypothetical protein MITS9509_01467 [Synechococcus sp. MIT S9509]|nr:hypothetical protein MITS9504_01185 [Synechococcus sp. MIT S9504]KZR92476.1 hypothetical protein MITS9509_01467 [Synechococcus sp. MIT S9509]
MLVAWFSAAESQWNNKQDSVNDVAVSDGVMIDGYDQICVARSRRERLLIWINHL